MAKKKKKFAYKQRSSDTYKDRANSYDKQFDRPYKKGTKLWKCEGEDHAIRVLPPTWDGADHYGLDIMIHWGVGPDTQSYLCPKEHGEGKCPVCEAVDAEWRASKAEGRDPDEDIKKLGAKKRTLVNIVDRNQESEGVFAWGMPVSVDKAIWGQQEHPRTGEVVNIDDPEEGFDVYFKKTGKGLSTRYESVMIDRSDPTPLSEDPSEMDEWLDFVVENPLDGILQCYTYEHINAVFSGEPEEEEEDEAPKSRPKGRARRLDDQHEDADSEEENEEDELDAPSAEEDSEDDTKSPSESKSGESPRTRGGTKTSRKRTRRSRTRS